MSFSETDRGADVWGEGEWQGTAWQLVAQTPQGGLRCALRIPGRHNLRNALAVIACALAAGVPLAAVAQGLAAFEPVKGRSRCLPLTLQGRTVTVVDDSYNANPDSVRAAIEVLVTLPAPRLLVLGDMGEVGEAGLAFHQEVLRHAAALGLDQVLCTGDWFRHAVPGVAGGMGATRLAFFDDFDALQQTVLASSGGAGSVLVKGSRFMRMERVVQALQEAATQGDKTC